MLTDTNEILLPTDFVYGVATSAYQIEGAANEEGRGPSIWDTFSHTPGKTIKGEHGDVACDHYHRMQDDVALIASLGVDAYRFSISWSRVQPDGSGPWNEKGLSFYDRLCDALMALGIAPHITLYHWDLPQALEDKGGWTNPETARLFAEYAGMIARRFADRAVSISTHNEPWCTAFLGNYHGMFAPGYRDIDRAVTVAHQLLISHGLAIQAIRSVSTSPKLGIVLNQSRVTPATQLPGDLASAECEHAKLTRWFMDPLLKGVYPDVAGVPRHPEIGPNDMAIIGQPLDFLGINYYTRTWVSSEQPPRPAPFAAGATAMGWEVYPEGLSELLIGHKQDYANLPPIYIMENGMAGADYLVDGAVLDYQRIDYVREHLRAIAKAVDAGVDIKGYFYWSLMDNFEWNSGYSKRFGLIHIDYATQQRTPKLSAHWYRDFIAATRTRRQNRGN